jgi:hypothetical protein
MGARTINPGNGQLAARPNSTTVMCLSGRYDIDLIACAGRVKCRMLCTALIDDVTFECGIQFADWINKSKDNVSTRMVC